MRLSHTVLSMTALAFGLAFAASISAYAKEPARVCRHSVHVSRTRSETRPRSRVTHQLDRLSASRSHLPLLGPPMYRRLTDDCNFGCIDNGH
jgi:hypothetical protein